MMVLDYLVNIMNISTRYDKHDYLSIVSRRYYTLRAINKTANFYEYKKEIIKIMDNLSKEVLDNRTSKLPVDFRKIHLTNFGK